ncbi:TPA: excalibur calcium-binding domain-containing protein, partial [Vibrio vulnificus]|nr:excalibur calcium-binding domain-containing protein [Vibrio vulnificus]
AYENMGFSCEGKTYCSEMVSCDEAKFYLSNCPHVKIDGDRDGIPCESQLCGGW